MSSMPQKAIFLSFHSLGLLSAWLAGFALFLLVLVFSMPSNNLSNNHLRTSVSIHLYMYALLYIVVKMNKGCIMQLLYCCIVIKEAIAEYYLLCIILSRQCIEWSVYMYNVCQVCFIYILVFIISNPPPQVRNSTIARVEAVTWGFETALP